MLTLLVISDIAFLLVLLWVRRRLEYLEMRTDLVVRGEPSTAQLQRLEARIDALERRRSYGGETTTRAPEHTVAGPRPAAAATPEPAPAAQVVAESQAAEQIWPRERVDAATDATTAQPSSVPHAPEPIAASAFTPAAERPAFVAEPTLPGRLRAWLGDQEWETLVGGSVVNKIGAVVLVIGIALFLGYSFRHIGPWGRALTAIAVSLSMLAGGVFYEKRPRFRIFSRGLIGAGWAALYATAFAIYAIPEARIINDAFAGSLVLLAVACGMIGHSVKYRVQAVTAVAYFAAFSALAITPATPLAVVSLLPLGASVLYLAWRFQWYPIALFGAAATYATCLSKGDPNASLAGSQAILLAYWLLFELFDLLRVRQRVTSGGVEWIAPINAAGFLSISYLAWAGHAPEQLWLASAGGATLYLGSAIARAWLRPPSSFSTGDNLVVRLRQGSFEGATLVAAGLAAMAVLGRAPGVWSSFGFALEAELLYLAGLAFGSYFLRRFGACFFAVSLGRLAWTASPPAQTTVLGGEFWSWTPGALLHAFLFYVNRGLRRPGGLFSTAAACLVGLVLAAELPQAYAGLGWTIFGMLLLELGLLRKQLEFRVQGIGLVAAGTLWTVSLNLFAAGQPWQPLAICLALVYAFTLQIRFELPKVINRHENKILETGGACGTTVTAAVLLWHVVPLPYLGISWCLLTLALLELGLRRLPSALRGSLLPMTMASTFAIFVTHVADLNRDAPQATLPTYVAAAVCGAALIWRLRGRRTELSRVEELTQNWISALAAVAFSTVLWLVLPNSLLGLALLSVAALLVEIATRSSFPFLKWVALGESALALLHVCAVDIPSGALVAGVPQRLLVVPPAIAGLYWLRRRFELTGQTRAATTLFWCAFVPLLWLPYAQFGEQTAAWWAGAGVALLAFGVYRADQHARFQSYILCMFALAHALGFDIVPSRLAVSVPVVVLLYAAHFLAKRAEEPRVPQYLSLGATLLLCAVLYGEVSGGMLTVAWGVAGLALLSSGFPLRNRIFRLQGMALLLICTVKLFLYDLRNLETPYRIPSFIGLGLILLSVSWIYTRFRDRVKRIL